MLRKLWAPVYTGACFVSARIAFLYERYLEHVKWDEFCGAVGVAFASGFGMGLKLGLDTKHAQYIGYLMAAFTAIAFLRNPKNQRWESPVPASTQESPESEASDAATTDPQTPNA